MTRFREGDPNYGVYPYSNWFIVNSLTAQYPSNGIGGSTTTAANSVLLNANKVVIQAVVIATLAASITTIELREQDGTTVIYTLGDGITSLPVSSGNLVQPVDILLGIPVDGGISARTSNVNTTAYVIYQKVA